MKKALLPLAMVAALSAGSASAAFLPFDVNPAAFGDNTKLTFTATGLAGEYNEIAALTPTGSDSGSFLTSMLWTVDKFTPLVSSGVSGLNTYGLYALMQFTGTYSTTAGVTTFDFSGGGFDLYYDGGGDTVFNAGNMTTPVANWLTSGYGTDKLLATGSYVAGLGTLSCTGTGGNCGSFGVDTTFTLTTDGEAYFVQPRPFYNLSLNNGQFDGFVLPTVIGEEFIQPLSGTLNAHFGVVPEPGTLALLGLGMVGLGLSQRRRKAA